MLDFGPVSSLLDVLMFMLMWSVPHARTLAAQTQLRSGWFVEGVLSQTLAAQKVRTRGITFVDSRPGTPLIVTRLVVVVPGC